MIAVWHVLVYYFAWPYGNVYGNVWAIVPCGIIAGLWGRAKVLKWHRANLERDKRRHDEIMDAHRKILDKLKEKK